MWDRAESALEQALRSQGLDYDLNEGDGAFYGPKIDLHMTDSIGRSWQLGTVQHLGLLGEAIVCEIAAQQKKIRPLVDGLEQGAQRSLGRLFDVEVADSGQ